MAPDPRIFRDRVSEAGTKFHRARLVDKDRNVLDQSSFTGTVRKRVYDLHSTDIDTPVYQTSNTIASNVFSSLQTWDLDDVGYNFQGQITSNNVSWEGGHTYRICYYLTRTSGEGVMVVPFENVIEPLLGA
jgi:hypothetical protein